MVSVDEEQTGAGPESQFEALRDLLLTSPIPHELGRIIKKKKKAIVYNFHLI